MRDSDIYLKPCPFCGEVYYSERGPRVRIETALLLTVRCGSCGAETRPFWERDEAVAAWNRRRKPSVALYAIVAEPFVGDELHHEFAAEVLGVFDGWGAAADCADGYVNGGDGRAIDIVEVENKGALRYADSD